MGRNRVKKAEDRVAKAQLELAKAKETARIAELEALCRKAEKALKAAGSALYEVSYFTEFDPEFMAVGEAFNKMRSEFCAVAFGARRRLELLNKLDPDRWPLEGEFARDLSGLTEDEDMAYDIATWIFDSGFGRGSEGAYAMFDEKDKGRFNTQLNRAVEVLGDIGTLGFELWAQGRHDT